MNLLDTLQTKQPSPMSGRATFGISRPVPPPRRLEKVRPIVLNESVDVQERIMPNDIDLSLDVNKDIPIGNDLPQNGGITGRPSAQDQTDSLFEQIAGLQNKDYGPRQKGGFKDILIALGMGALQGVANSDPRGGTGAMLGGALGGAAAGGIGGAIDGSTDNRMRDRLKLDRLYSDYANASKIADAEQNRAWRKTQIDNMIADNAARDAAAKAKIEKEQRDYDLKVKMADWKIEDRQTYWEWEQVKEQAKRDGKQKDYELAVRKQEEIERNNRAKIDATNENVDRRINANPKNNPAPPRTPAGKPAAVPAKTALESGLTSRGIKPGSPEWNKVMQAAGY